MTDSELVRGCLEGDRESYRMIMERYRQSAMGVAVNILANYQDAEDTCQEAFLRAYQNLGRYDPERSFKNWFYTLLSNLCLDQIRKKKSFKSFLGRFRKEDEAAAVVLPHNPAPRECLESRFLRRLTPRERTSLYLWAQEGYSGAEIASVLGCSEKTVNVYMFRARTKIRAMMKEKKDGTQ